LKKNGFVVALPARAIALVFEKLLAPVFRAPPRSAG
jgi:hypothetical protein